MVVIPLPEVMRMFEKVQFDIWTEDQGLTGETPNRKTIWYLFCQITVGLHNKSPAPGCFFAIEAFFCWPDSYYRNRLFNIFRAISRTAKKNPRSKLHSESLLIRVTAKIEEAGI
ncbi:MAG: hypothetical protein ACI8PB_002750 [Desulforhopalus sp.]|jgi:hypothetical protein